MDRRLTERMIGAVVLVAAAIILIPEMLSGPHVPQVRSVDGKSPNDVPPAPTGPDGQKLKTYTIDLAKTEKPEPPKSETPTKSEIPKPSTLPESAASVKPEPESSPRVEIHAAPPTPNTSDIAATPTVADNPKPVESTAKPEPVSKPVVPAAPRASPATSATGWSVQVGSFGVRATSDRLAAELKRAGFPAFVVPFQSGNQTMFRVRVGPVRDKAAGEALLQKLKPEYAGATLVPPV